MDAHSLAAKQPSDKSIVKKEKKNYHGWENIGEKIYIRLIGVRYMKHSLFFNKSDGWHMAKHTCIYTNTFFAAKN